LKHTASKRFWQCLDALPADVQTLARRNFALLKTKPTHPSLHFKTLGNGRFHSVRVGLYYRALGLPVVGGVHWFWIGTHGEYDRSSADEQAADFPACRSHPQGERGRVHRHQPCACASTMQALQSGKTTKPHFGVGFAPVGQMLAVFTPKRCV
jgi:hypothetical protein